MFGGKSGGKGGIREESKQEMKRLAKIEDERKIYLGNLPRGVHWQGLESFVKEKTSKPKITHIMGFGKAALAFATAEEAVAATAALNGEHFKGKTLEADP